MSYAWYPLNKIDGRCVLLAYAEMRDECQEVHVALLVCLEEIEGQEAFRDQISDLEDYDQDVQDEIEAELLAVGSDASHDNWKGFAQFLDLAFPRPSAHDVALASAMMIECSGPAPINPETGQHGGHFVLSAEERAKGHVRPVRTSYKHEKCGSVTTMPLAIGETYAREPDYYGQTFCCSCRTYLPVGESGEFVWLDDGTKVGT